MGQLKRWKQGTTVHPELVVQGVIPRDAAGVAAHTRRSWFAANLPAMKQAFHPAWYDQRGSPRLAATPQPSNRRMRTRTSGGVGGAR